MITGLTSLYKTILVPFFFYLLLFFKAASLLSIEANIPFHIFFPFLDFFKLVLRRSFFFFQVYSTTLFTHQL